VIESPEPVGAGEYPAELEHGVVLADGRSVLVRPIRPSDADEMRRALTTADAETLRARFMGSPPHTEASIRRLVEVDYVHRLALVALTPGGTGVGIARYEGRTGSDTAEVAIAVDQDWRRVCLGSLLLRELGEAALRRGVRCFTAMVQADNAPALALLHGSGLKYSSLTEGGTSQIVIELESAS
jgi:L-amino acid N-acyltransferase YncA